MKFGLVDILKKNKRLKMDNRANDMVKDVVLEQLNVEVSPIDYTGLGTRDLIEAYVLADTEEEIKAVGDILGKKDMWDNEHKYYKERYNS